MRICEIMQMLRLHLEPLAREHALAFSIASDPGAPYKAILEGGSGGMCILCYAGQSRIDETPGTRPPVSSRFELFVSASTALSADKAGGGGVFRPAGAVKPLYEICEQFEADLVVFEIPANDGTVEKRPFYQSTDPAVMPDGYVLSAYKISFQIRRAMH